MNPLKVISKWWGTLFDRRYWSPFSGGRETTSSERISEESALNYSAVWCATRLLCGTAASLPCPVFSGLDTEDRTKERGHPVHFKLNRMPNPELTAFNWRSVMWQWIINWGNGYSEIEREGNDPEGELIALWPIHPWRVEVKRDENDDLYYEVREEDKPSGPPKILPPWRMFHVPSIITRDGICGLGVIEHARETIGAGIAGEKYAANWFGGGGVPRVVIEHDRIWSQEARDAFRKEWDDIYTGPNARRIAVLEAGAKAKPLNISQEDSQFLETRQFDVEEIARWYGIPPHLLQHLLHAHFNNVEQLGISFVQYSLIPWLRIWEQCVSQKLFTTAEREELFAEHNVDALKRGDSTARAQFYTAMTAAAIMTRNDCRKLENLDPVEGGDTFLVQGAVVPLDEMGKPESEFAGNAGPSESQPESQSNVAGKVQRVLHGHLSRILVKETKRMRTLAGKPGRFCFAVDDFYAAHVEFVSNAVTDTLEALVECGVEVDAKLFVDSWINDGKLAMLEVAGNVGPAQLADAVAVRLESEQWKTRPAKALQSCRATCG